jgi:hypothetical protein
MDVEARIYLEPVIHAGAMDDVGHACAVELDDERNDEWNDGW